MKGVTPKVFDVAICGGGLAGLTLGRQLKLARPELRIVVLEKSQRPLPAACHKVGESSVELGAHYFSHVLGLKDYLEKNHLPKLGLRFFFGDSRSPLEERPEWGASRFPPVPSYQLDRGVLENDLRRLSAESGISLWEGCAVEDIVLAQEGHEVHYRKDGVGGKLEGRWVIDSTGRRRLLQSKLGLKRDNGHKASAIWFRMPGRIDVSDLVPSKNQAWHDRVPGRNRYYSTNHLMGRGYWVWLIPLSSGPTSIGIVADENSHPFRSYGSFKSAMAWLGEHEPRLAAFLRGRDPLDFKKMKHFSYSSAQVFSHERWACVGEAGLFTDPFYSPGSDFIAMGNSMVVKMILLDREGRLSPEVVGNFDRLYLLLYEIALDFYRNSYPIFGTTHVMTAKNIWDWCLYWGFTTQVFFRGLLAEPQWSARLLVLGEKFHSLNARVQQCFRDWASRVKARDCYSFLELFQFPLLRSLHLGLRDDKTPEETFRDMEWALARLEELAQVLAAQAARETGQDELFQVEGRPRDLSSLREEMDLIFTGRPGEGPPA